MKYLKCAFLAFLISFSFSASFAAQHVIENRFDPTRIDEEEGRQRITAFRNYRYNGDYSLIFNLIHMPRRGGQEVYNGTLWGTWNAQGPVTRIELKPYRDLGKKSIRLLVQNGPNPKIWYLAEGGKVQELDKKDWFKPLFEDIVYTPFDLSLSFLFWDDFSYEGPKRVKGRPAQLFLMKPPAEFAKSNRNLGGVHVAMDTNYNVLLQADLLDANGNPLKAIKLNNFKKVREEYVIKQLDVVDEQTHDKTRFEVSAALLGLSIDPKYFDPQTLNSENPTIDIRNYHHLN